MVSSRLSKLCDSFLEAGWLLAALVTPLFINLYTSRGVEPDKVSVLRAITIGMAVVWLIGRLDRRGASCDRTAMWRTPLFIATVVLIGAQLLSTATSLAPRISWWGAYPRPEGVYSLVCYATIFMIMIQTVQTRAQIDRLITTLILTSVPVVLYGLIQRAGLDPFAWSNEVTARAGSTLGNPIFLGAYLIMIAPLTLSRVAAAWSLKTDRRWTRIAAVIVYASIAALQVTGIVLTGSRGPFLGALAGLFLFGVLMTWLWRRRIWTVVLLGAASLGVATLILINVSGANNGNAADLTRLTSLTVTAGDTATARLWYWDNASRLILPHAPLQSPDGANDPINGLRPLLGYGPDTFYFAFRQMAAPGFETIQSYDVTSDRSHNETWDTLTQLGGLGWLAYQFFYANVFVCGFRCLGLIVTRRQRNFFIAAWITCTLLGALIALMAADVRYLGLGLGVGNVAAPIVFAVAQALRQRSAPSSSALSVRDQFLVVALLGGMTAHLMEIQFGLALVTTRVAFWMFAAICVVLNSGRLNATSLDSLARVAPDKRSPALAATPPMVSGQAALYGLITAAILCTLLFAFTMFTPGETNALSLIQRALTFNSLTNRPSTVLPVLLSLTWAAALALTLFELHLNRNPLTRHDTWPAIKGFALTSLGLSSVFVLTLGGYLSGLSQTLVEPINVDAALARSAQAAHIVDVYLIALLSITMLMTLIALRPLQASSDVWMRRRSSLMGAVILIGLGSVCLQATDLNSIRADVYHKLGVEYEVMSPGVAVSVFRRAILLSPQEDYYYMAWGRALVTHAKDVIASGMETTTQLSDQTRLEDVLALDDQQLTKLNRMDLLYAAQVALQHARALNPLYPDHTLNLTRFYLPELPVNTEARSKLAALADNYYAQAIRLSPSSAAYWNEWAEFEQTYKADLDRALEKLAQSLRLNPAYADTHLQQGKVYAAQAAWSLARAAYQRAAELRPQWAEAYSGLAFAHYQLQELPEAVTAYHRYIELAPDAPNLWEAHKNLALIYKQLGELTHALNEVQLAASLTTGDVQVQLSSLAAQWQTR